METKKLKLVISTVSAVLVLYLLCVHATAEEGVAWNQDANSLVLNSTELTKFGDAFPAWKIKQIAFPSTEEISSKSVSVDEKLKESCIDWLKKFIKADRLPVDLRNHLIPMEEWGLISRQFEQKRLCDVFVVRFKIDSYIVHIQESPYNVIVAVADERYAKDAKTDKKKLATSTAALFLSDKLIPDPNSENVHVSELTGKQNKITRISWLVEDTIGTEKDGKKYTDLEKAGKIGTESVEAETDGRFVKFEIIKCPGAVKRGHFDPHIERFSPAPVEQEEKPKKPRSVPPAPGPGGFGPMPDKYDPNSAPPPKKNP